MVDKPESNLNTNSSKEQEHRTSSLLVEESLDESIKKNLRGEDLLGPAAAPSNVIGRHALATVEGLYNLPSGIIGSAYHSLTHPIETAQIALSGAALGAGLKLVLPEAGPVGKIAGAAIGLYFTYEASKPMIEAYKEAHYAKTMTDIEHAGKKIGNAGGDFIVHSGIAMLGYKAGAGAAEYGLLSERMDGFADWKQAKWDRLTNTFGKVSDRVIGNRTVPHEDPNPAPRAGTSRYLPSNKSLPENVTAKGEIDPGSPMEATVLLKSKGTDLAMDRTLKRIQAGRQGFLTDEQIGAKFGPNESAITEITKFAKDNGLSIKSADVNSGRIVLSGEAGKFSEAFQIPLKEYTTADGVTFRGRQGALALPNNLQGEVQGVYGLDNRPQARSYIRFQDPNVLGEKVAELGKPNKALEPHNSGGPRAEVDTSKPSEGIPQGPEPKARNGHLPNEIADAYNFPKESMGENTSVAIIQLGGGIDLANEAAYYKQYGLPQPEIKTISVGGASTSPSGNPRFDGEVVLDSQIVGAIAPKAQQKLIFAPNTDAGFIDAVTRGTFHDAAAGEKPTTAISISWGQAEEAWTPQAISGLNAAFKKAAMKGISIFAAAGDDGAVDGAPSGRFNADYPAADPNVTAAGGTRLIIENGRIASETAWNSSGGATGGGFSNKFPRPDYQKQVSMPGNPQNPNFVGRGVPDISGNADPAVGWKIKLAGSDQVSGGTSAVAPMFAGLNARISGALGRNTGPWNPFLYKSGVAGSTFYNDVVTGHNNGYSTSFGWDPVTGWGSVNGAAMLDAMRFSVTALAPKGPLVTFNPGDGSNQSK